MAMAKLITLDMLIEKNACAKQANLFKKYFDESVEITEDICLKYYDKFEVDWLVDNMLNEDQREAYNAIEMVAWKDYKAIVEPAWKDYMDIHGPAWKAYKVIQESAYKAYEVIQWLEYEKYEAIRAPAYAAYRAIKASAYEEYAAILTSAHTKYKKERARAFFIAYNS